MPESANEHLDYLRKYLRADDSIKHILDVGMGRGNYGWFLRQDVKWSGKLTGIEVWAPYVIGPDALAGRNRDYYDGGIILGDMRELFAKMVELKPDVIFAFDVIEHVVKKEGIACIRAMQRAAGKAVLVCPPIVPYPQGEYMGNPHEAHKHDWTVQEMLALGSELRHTGGPQGATGLFEFPARGCDRKVTVMLNTARSDEDFGGGRSILKQVTEDLAKQTFPLKDLEFIAVDGTHEDRFSTFAEHNYPFRILHVPPKDCVMVRERRPAICAYKNTAIAHARGELLITVDDCATFGPKFVERCWASWVKGHCLGALYHGVTHEGAILGGPVHTDSRMLYLDTDGKCVGPLTGNPLAPPGQGFLAFPLSAALALNGYDEMFDGSRGLEDTDFGLRLQKSGERLALDKEHQVGLFLQGGWSSKLFDRKDPSQGVVKCGQTTFRIRFDRVMSGRFEANREPWSEQEWAAVTPRCRHLTSDNCCGLFPAGQPCPYVGFCSDAEHPGLRFLKNEPPVFDLRALRHDNGII